MKNKLTEILRTSGRILIFRATREEVERFDYWYLLFGLVCTWLVGVGRSWDDPKAELFQHLGVGSVIYVFVLTFVLWVVINPLVPARHLYVRMLTYICLVSPPGFIYAIPVEKFLAPPTAGAVNMGFLAVVATWRVALWVRYLAKIEMLDWYEVLVLALLPLSAIVGALSFLHELDATFENMGGWHGHNYVDPFATVWHYLGILSIWTFLPLSIAYLFFLARAGKGGRISR